jgi:uncharacterized protein YvpB
MRARRCPPNLHATWGRSRGSRPRAGCRHALFRLLTAAVFTTLGSAVLAQSVSAQSGVYLDAPNIKQDKPLDCEAASLQIALAVAGYSVSQDAIFNSLPQDARPAIVSNGAALRWGDPNAAFVGNVYGAEANFTGYGVYQAPIVNMAAAYGAWADGHNGWTVPAIEYQIRQGNAVIVWLNANFTATGVRYWTAWDGTSIPYTTYEHTVVVVGFDPGAHTVTVVDVATGTRRTFSEASFASLMTTFNGMAVTVSRPFHGATVAAAVTSDKKADAVAINAHSAYVMLSTGTAFSAPTAWSGNLFYGRRATVAADVSGDGSSDLIAVNDSGTWVMTSTGGGFSAPTAWSTVPFYGSLATVAADVNGDGKADLVAINENSVYVMLSTGTGFTAPTAWSTTPFYGSIATVAADVNGDGRMDLVAINVNNVYVMLSNGHGFSAPTPWSTVPFYGSRATLAADVTADGKADLVAVNDSSTWVMSSTGSGFSAPAAWSTAPFYGSRATVAGDVTGDGKEGLVAVNDASTWVMPSTGNGFSAPAAWSTTPFYGS